MPVGFFHRDTKILKSKYENLKKQTKRKLADEKRYVMGTGGGPPIKHQIYQRQILKIKDIVGDLVLSGQVSKFDSDAVDNNLNQVEIELVNENLNIFWDINNIPVLLEEEFVENLATTGEAKTPNRFEGFIVSQPTITELPVIDLEQKPTPSGIFNVQDSPRKSRTEESSTAVPSTPKIRDSSQASSMAILT